MYLEVSKRTPLRRTILISLLPLTAALVFSCAQIERPVRVPVVANAVIAPRPVRVWVGTGTVNQPLELSAAEEVGVWRDLSTPLGKIRLDKARPGFSRGAVTIESGGARSGALRGADVVEKHNWGLPAVILVAGPGDCIRVQGNEYPGDIVLVAQGESVQAINYVPIEEYVAGVVSCEMPAWFGRAALQAQAVAARTYVLWQMRENGLSLFDLRNDQHSQMYRGLSGMVAAGRQAAQRTAGTVLLYEWRFLPALYFSTCGGHTIPAGAVSWAPRVAPLAGVDCGYCTASPRYTWWYRESSQKLAEALAAGNFVAGRLLDVRISKTVPGGWVDTVEVVGEAGTRMISGQILRQVVGTAKVRSTKFTVQKSGEEYVFHGYGFGHGCGMCQWGADGMSRAGSNYVEILQHYYPGASAIKIY